MVEVEMPETRYARAPDGVHIAFQVVGDGPFDLVYAGAPFQHVEGRWDVPGYAYFFRRLAGFSRLILFDKRGTGLSDRGGPDPTLEQQMDDIGVVLDASGSPAAAFLGYLDGGMIASMFAATYPERTTALALYATPARFSANDEYPWGFDAQTWDELNRAVEDSFALDTLFKALAPSRANDSELRAVFNRLARISVGPGGFMAMIRTMASADIRDVLPVLRVPTLVMGRERDKWYPPDAGRYVAARIPGARYVSVTGSDTVLFDEDDFGPVIDEVEEFLTGVRRTSHADRVLATVLFTDIVGSTQLAARLGDREWRRLLDRHDELVRRQLARFRGKEVKTTGDGFMATFDGPARGVRCAQAIAEGAATLGTEIRAGLHTGECEVRGDDLGGIGVHIAARVAALACGGEVLVSSTVKDLVAGSGLAFADHGEHDLKGIPDRWRLFAVGPG